MQDSVDQISVQIPCALCEVAPGISKHHTLPKSQGGRETVSVCHECHTQIHKVLTNKQLAKNFYTIEKLMEFEEIKKWVAWRRKHPNVTVSHKMSRDRRKKSKYA